MRPWPRHAKSAEFPDAARTKILQAHLRKHVAPLAGAVDAEGRMINRLTEEEF